MILFECSPCYVTTGNRPVVMVVTTHVFNQYDANKLRLVNLSFHY